MSRILVTGATALVGAHVVAEFHGQGYDLRALVRGPARAAANAGAPGAR